MRALSIASLAVLLVGASYHQAIAQQTKPQQKCINFLNKGIGKIGAKEHRAVTKCVKAYAKKPMTAPDPNTCSNSPAKVTAAQTKFVTKGMEKCMGAGVPTIGPTSPGNTSYYAYDAGESIGYGLISNGDLLSSDIVKCSDAPAKVGCKCQDTLLGKAGRLFGMYTTLFNKCKKNGLKKATIITSADIGLCLTDATKLDPKGKRTKALTKLLTTITKKCSTPVTNPLPNGVCATMTGTNLRDCVDRWVRCEACRSISFSDNLSLDCEMFDNNVMDASCYSISD